MIVKGKLWVDWQTHDTVGVWQVCDMIDEDMMLDENMVWIERWCGNSNIPTTDIYEEIWRLDGSDLIDDMCD